MNFATLNSSVTDLRNGLSAHISGTALQGVNSRPPSGANDEASFLRLTTWCYILLFESGRVSVQYLLKVPSSAGDASKRDHARQTRKIVNILRSWFFHNLDFDDEKRKNVSQWFLDTCEVIVPTEKKHWRLCFKKLCSDVTELVNYCNEVFSGIAASPDDCEIIFSELKRRLERNWPAVEFDKIVIDAATLIGERIDVGKFRNTRISAWRQFLDQLSEHVDLKKEATRIIERDIFDHFRSMLPITTIEIMKVLDLAPGPEVKQAIAMARELFDNGVRAPDTLLRQLSNDYKVDKNLRE